MEIRRLPRGDGPARPSDGQKHRTTEIGQMSIDYFSLLCSVIVENVNTDLRSPPARACLSSHNELTNNSEQVEDVNIDRTNTIQLVKIDVISELLGTPANHVSQ